MDCMGNPSICDGTLSADEFYIAAKALCEKWKVTNTTLPNWMWVPYKRIHASASCNVGDSYPSPILHRLLISFPLYFFLSYFMVVQEGYLSLENIYHVKSSKDLVSSEDLSEEEESVDNATMVQLPSNMIHVYDFHIVYSFSYRAPILYFHGHHCDGQPLKLNDIHKDLPEYSLKLLTESKWTFITVEDHPYMHQPWFFLHPCGTSDWMKLLLSGGPQAHPGVNYLFSWLSVVGQVVGLGIPIGLASNSLKGDSSSSTASIRAPPTHSGEPKEELGLEYEEVYINNEDFLILL